MHAWDGVATIMAAMAEGRGALGAKGASTVSAPLGALACQRDATLRTLATTVVQCMPTATAAEDGTALYDVILRDTGTPTAQPTQRAHVLIATMARCTTVLLVLFPEGGGQPHDLGTVRVPLLPKHT
jgi:hypothetical protein